MGRSGINLGLLGAWLALLAGCGPQFSEKARFGLTVYGPGAGNVDFGDSGIREGLTAAGYKGEVASFVWTISLNPAIDQVVRFNARFRAKLLASMIEDYIDQYVKSAPPGQPPPQVNLVGLSAGTGVVVWALEDLKPGYMVDNVVLLSSSLSHDYDATEAVQRVKGNIYNYFSPNDIVLAGPMKIFGSIDGVFGQDGAGAVGLHPPKSQDKIVNIRWQPEYEKYGYYGGHLDSTSPRFVEAVLARHLLKSPATERTPASPMAKAAQDAGPR